MIHTVVVCGGGEQMTKLYTLYLWMMYIINWVCSECYVVIVNSSSFVWYVMEDMWSMTLSTGSFILQSGWLVGWLQTNSEKTDRRVGSDWLRETTDSISSIGSTRCRFFTSHSCSHPFSSTLS